MNKSPFRSSTGTAPTPADPLADPVVHSVMAADGATIADVILAIQRVRPRFNESLHQQRTASRADGSENY